jgi:hypothetical protein
VVLRGVAFLAGVLRVVVLRGVAFLSAAGFLGAARFRGAFFTAFSSVDVEAA